MQQNKNSLSSPLFGLWAGVCQESRFFWNVAMAETVRIISALCELKRGKRLVNGLISCGYRGVFGSHNYLMGSLHD